MAEPALPIPVQEIPDKLYFRIGEVARLTGIKPYVLRFWENEFPGLGPKKSGTGHRLFRRKDVEMVLEIKHLLYEKRYTIEGARKWFETRGKPAPAPSAKAAKAAKSTKAAKPAPQQQGSLFAVGSVDLDKIRVELQAILDLIK